MTSIFEMDFYLSLVTLLSAMVLSHSADTECCLIESRFGIARRMLLRLLDRCIAPHPDGRIQGFRGLIPFEDTVNLTN